MMKVLKSAAAALGLLLCVAQSHAAYTMAAWQSAGAAGITVGDVTWRFIASPNQLPGTFEIDFTDAGAFQIQSGETDIQTGSPITYTLRYTATLNNDYNFTGVRVDSTLSYGSSTVTKTVYDSQGGTFLATVSSQNGTENPPNNPSIVFQPFAYPSTTIYVDETISVGGTSLLRDFSNSYTTAVPEPATLLAGSLLLIPFAASAVRFARKNR